MFQAGPFSSYMDAWMARRKNGKTRPLDAITEKPAQHESACARAAAAAAHMAWPLFFTALLCLCCIVLGSTSANDFVSVATFSKLEQLCIGGGSEETGWIVSSEVRFPYQLDVPENATLLLMSGLDATLSGSDDAARMFYLRADSLMGLCGLNLVGGIGGAIYLSPGSELLLKYVRVVRQQADHGAAIYAVSATIIATGCTMSSNSAAIAGGVLYAAGNSTVVMMNSAMTSNLAGNGRIRIFGGEIVPSNGAGGAFYASGRSIVQMFNCTLASNSATFGGAAYGEGRSSVTTTDCTLSANSAVGGGAVYATARASLSARHCTVRSNSALAGAGVHATDGATVRTTACLFVSNAAQVGGALYAEFAAAVVATRCTMTSNSANRGVR